MPKAEAQFKLHWRHDLLVLDGAIVGSVAQDSFGRGWWAYGMLEDWEDSTLGLHQTQEEAKQEVELWVRANA
jgi:hypothetical protein